MATIKKVPAIRFKGFEEEWAELALQEIIDLKSGRDYKHLSPGNIPVYGTGGYMLSVNEALSYKENAIGIGRKGTIDKPYILCAPFWTVDTLFFALPKPNNDLDFIYSIFQRINWKQKDESTGVPSLSKSSINNINVAVVSALEQVQIGNYFKKLDDLIRLQEQKLEKVTNLKKAMLEKMFPRENADVPEIRFKEFTKKWEKKKLGEVGSVVMNKRIFKHQTKEIGEIPFYKIGTFGGKADAFISRAIFEDYKAKYPYPNKGDILISASGSIGKIVEYLGADEYFQDSNIVWLKHDNTVLNVFLKYFYFIVKWSGLEGSTIKRLYNNNILATYISLPSIPEQQKIGTYFQSLDQLITQSQEKIEKLRNIKQALLQKMFI